MEREEGQRRRRGVGKERVDKEGEEDKKGKGERSAKVVQGSRKSEK